MRLLFVLLGACNLLGISARAEYRAFLLKISTANSPDIRLIKSQLEPEQYPTYYPLRPGEKIQYIDTWMCRGRTNEDTDICPSPHALPPTSEAPPTADKG
jgi:hypothetical protein